MSRCNALVVALEQDINDEQAELLKSAIMQLRGVLSVDINVISVDSYVAEQRARTELGTKVFDFLYPPRPEVR